MCRFGCLPSYTMHLISLCTLLQKQESIPWKKTSQCTQRIRESMTELRKETLAKGYWNLPLCGQDVQIGRKFTQVEPDGPSISQL